MHILQVPQHVVALNLGCVPILHSGRWPQLPPPPPSGLNVDELPPAQPAYGLKGGGVGGGVGRVPEPEPLPPGGGGKAWAGPGTDYCGTRRAVNR